MISPFCFFSMAFIFCFINVGHLSLNQLIPSLFITVIMVLVYKFSYKTIIKLILSVRNHISPTTKHYLFLRTCVAHVLQSNSYVIHQTIMFHLLLRCNTYRYSNLFLLYLPLLHTHTNPK